MPVIDYRMGVATAACLLDLWLERKMSLTREEYDWLCATLYDLLGECRDEQWRLVGTMEDTARDTIPDE